VKAENSLGGSAPCGWKREEASMESVEARIQEPQWRAVLKALLPTLPALAKQLRDVAQEGERMATQVSAQFLQIAEKIGAPCGSREGKGTSHHSPADSTTTSSEAVVREISDIIVELQFQDAASQRLGNLANVLDEMESVMNRWVSAAPEHRRDVGDLVSMAWAERIRSIRPDVTYTTRAPLSGSPTSTGAKNNHTDHGKVELF
jgi:hypothetical protein